MSKQEQRADAIQRLKNLNEIKSDILKLENEILSYLLLVMEDDSQEEQETDYNNVSIEELKEQYGEAVDAGICGENNTKEDQENYEKMMQLRYAINDKELEGVMQLRYAINDKELERENA